MKKTLKTLLSATLIASLCLTSTALAFAEDTDGFKVDDQTVSDTEGISEGNLPKFINVGSEALDTKLNEMVKEFKDSAMTAASANNVEGPKVDFSYETYTTDQYFSVVLLADSRGANTGNTTVKTIVLDQATGQICTLEDILGVNAPQVANNFLKAEVQQYPSKYLPDVTLPTLDNDSLFYINNYGNMVLIFNKYDITPGSAGIPRLVLPLKSYQTGNLPLNETYLNGTTRMAPLNTAMDMFKINFTQDKAAKTCQIGTGRAVLTLKAGVNDYDGKQLACAPEIKDGTMYVPVTFLEQYSGIACSEQGENLALAKLTAPHIISGKVVDATMNTVIIDTADGWQFAFSTTDADKTECNGLQIGSDIAIHYTGTLDGNSTSEAVVSYMTQL